MQALKIYRLSSKEKITVLKNKEFIFAELSLKIGKSKEGLSIIYEDTELCIFNNFDRDNTKTAKSLFIKKCEDLETKKSDIINFSEKLKKMRILNPL